MPTDRSSHLSEHPDLSPETAARLAEVRSRGIQVIGPIPAEDTSSHAQAESVGWEMALQVGEGAASRVVTGKGPTPEAAAASALALLGHPGV